MKHIHPNKLWIDWAPIHIFTTAVLTHNQFGFVTPNTWAQLKKNTYKIKTRSNRICSMEYFYFSEFILCNRVRAHWAPIVRLYAHRISIHSVRATTITHLDYLFIFWFVQFDQFTSKRQGNADNVCHTHCTHSHRTNSHTLTSELRCSLSLSSMHASIWRFLWLSQMRLHVSPFISFIYSTLFAFFIGYCFRRQCAATKVRVKSRKRKKRTSKSNKSNTTTSAEHSVVHDTMWPCVYVLGHVIATSAHITMNFWWFQWQSSAAADENCIIKLKIKCWPNGPNYDM